MKITKKIFTICILSLFLSSNTVFAQNYNLVPRYPGNTPSNTYQADIQSQRLPAGTRLKLKMETPINSHNSRKGDAFVAYIVEDTKVSNNIVLPAGTSIRGRIKKIQSNGFLSRGANMLIAFDHLVTPVGRQIPVIAKVSKTDKYEITEYGAVSAGGGWLDASGKAFNQGVDMAVDISGAGVRSGISLSKKMYNTKTDGAFKKAGVAMVSAVPVVLITPLAVAGGTVVGSTVFFGKSVIAVFKKGDIVQFRPGDVFTVTLTDPVDVPVN